MRYLHIKSVIFPQRHPQNIRYPSSLLHPKEITVQIIREKKNTLEELRNIRFRRNSSLQAVCDAPIARVAVCVFLKDIGRRLPLELACTRVNQKGHVTKCGVADCETNKPKQPQTKKSKSNEISAYRNMARDKRCFQVQ